MLIFLKMKYIYHEKEKPRFDIIQILRIDVLLNKY